MPNALELIPAIDLMDGRCVRLQQGDASRRTDYPQPPEAVAAEFERAGARRLHVVDLDGAFSGEPRNLDAVGAIRRATTMKLEVGGGIRTLDHARRLVDAGVDHFVLGTRALEDRDFLRAAVAEFGGRVIVGADARDGFLSTRGWTAATQVRASGFLASVAADPGVRTVIFTDIARDGMFNSPNHDALGEILAIPGLDVIASGGVGCAADLRALRALGAPNLVGVIVGKAIHDGRLSLTDALAACSQ